MPPLVLASASPRRRQILADLGLECRAIEPGYDEPAPPSGDAAAYAVANARAKAIAAASSVRRGFVIGVDTVVVAGRRMLGKPKGTAEAREMLRLLSGRSHRVVSGVAVVRQPGGAAWCGAEDTKVRFRRLRVGDLDRYLSTSEPLDKAGAYAIQGRASVFVDEVVGSYRNVVGLPVLLMLQLIRQADSA